MTSLLSLWSFESLPALLILRFILDYFDAHAAGSTGDDSEAGFVVRRVQILELEFDDVHHLFFRYFADFFFIRLLGPGGDTRGFLQQYLCRRCLGYQRKRVI